MGELFFLMRIFIIGSKYMYHRVPPVKEELERRGHSVTPPNCYDDPMLEERLKVVGSEEHAVFKGAMLREQNAKIRANDAVLVMNYEKNGQPNYIGGATFLEIAKAFDLEKKIYLMNPIPENIFTDELKGMRPLVIYGDLGRIGLDI